MKLEGYEFRHRGLHKNVPENSMSAFKKALYKIKIYPTFSVVKTKKYHFTQYLGSLSSSVGDTKN